MLLATVRPSLIDTLQMTLPKSGNTDLLLIRYRFNYSIHLQRAKALNQLLKIHPHPLRKINSTSARLRNVILLGATFPPKLFATLGFPLNAVSPSLWSTHPLDFRFTPTPCRSVPQDVEIATSIWIALHDPKKSVAEVAEDLWDCYDCEFGTDYSGLFRALSHVNYNVRVAASDALVAVLDEYPDTLQESLATLFSLYIRDSGVADVLRTKDLPVVMTFLISRALADTNVDVRGRMINAGIMIIDKYEKDNVSLLFPIFENYLNKMASDEEKYDLVREGVVIFTGALAKHLSKDDPKVHTVVEKLLEVINTPSEAVQRAVSSCLSPLMKSKQEDALSLVTRLLDQLMKSEKYGERRGAAFGLAGVIKGLGIS
ncbi:unnamed protein product [Lactuca saligna]|uniref:Uncharacterized protein n=1 Tax=Lactuca saligna TaxID=75948 RepID=A0AA35YYP9_LACSI|nr:unnamed protein product [Lactuca saligna]